MSKENTAPSSGVIQQKLSNSERFSMKVFQEFSGKAGEVSLTNHQKRLVQNYFISIDLALKSAEEKRMKKDEKYRDALPVTWENVNLESLAVHVVSCARIGFDPALPNHINMVPYKNNTLNKYEMVFIEGYRGKELKAMKYGYDVPSNVIVELVYENDEFKPFKRDRNNKTECYDFVVTEPFDRGEIIGGFYYHEYVDAPEKNRLVFMSASDIEKRKPTYASAEFWGGERDKWENGKKVGKEKVEGWYAEMMFKTLYRAAYSSITIDSQKIDDDFIRLSENENKSLEAKPDVIEISANRTTVNFDDASVIQANELPEKSQPSPQVAPDPETQVAPEPQPDPQPKMQF